MNSGSIEVAREELDLNLTMGVGQTFTWHRRDDAHLYEEGENVFYTTSGTDVLVLWQDEDSLHYEATGGMRHEIEDRLRLHESLQDIRTALRGRDELLDAALDRYPGLRVLNDDPFPCLISYLCSVQMRIPRIKTLYNTLAKEFGGVVEHQNQRFLRFPTVQELGEATEDELRDLGVGYRAKYIAEATDQLLREEVRLDEVADMEYEDAHDAIQQLYGVGDKVADCVLLFGMGFMEAVPIDTWIRQAVEQQYPERHEGEYHALADNLRTLFGDHHGYAQEYLFHFVRESSAI